MYRLIYEEYSLYIHDVWVIGRGGVQATETGSKADKGKQLNSSKTQ